MKFGVCGDMALAAIAAKADFDYAETGVGNLLRPLESDEAFEAELPAIKNAPLPYRTANGFVPGKLKITGPDADMSALETYVKTTMRRAEQLGLEVIVFGSGAARQIPDGFDRAQAHVQIVDFCKMVAPIAQSHGVTVAVEPLNKTDCNVLNTVTECADLVNEVNHPGVRLLADSYHMMRDGDPIQSIIDHGYLLAHVHIATVPNRLPPAAEECDLASFMEALNTVGYNGRISIEGKFPNPETQLPAAIAYMREFA